MTEVLLVGTSHKTAPIAIRERFVGDLMEERIVVENHGQRRVEIELGLELEADFADIFVVKQLEPGFGWESYERLPPPSRNATYTPSSATAWAVRNAARAAAAAT